MRHACTIASLAGFLAIACGGSDRAPATPSTGEPAAPTTGEPGAPAADQHDHDLPADLAAFHDVLAPVWHSEVTPKPACPNSSKLFIASENIDPMAAPEGVDPDAWMEAADLLLASALQLSQACNQMGDDAAAQESLIEMHDRFHALVALIGHEE